MTPSRTPSKGPGWREPYRGSRYIFNPRGIHYVVPKTHDRISANNYDRGLLARLLKLRPEGGRFRVDENGNIVTPIETSTPGAFHFERVGACDRTLTFDDVDLHPSGLSFGSLWTGFYSNHGTRFSLGWREEVFLPLPFGVRLYVDNPPPKLMTALRRFMPRGGRFYVTEFGHVWCNSEFRPDWKRMEEQIRGFRPVQRALFEQRWETTQRFPIYVGPWEMFGGSLAIDLEDYVPQDPNLIDSQEDEP